MIPERFAFNREMNILDGPPYGLNRVDPDSPLMNRLEPMKLIPVALSSNSFPRVKID
jgi:hypothetical protein